MVRARVAALVLAGAASCSAFTVPKSAKRVNVYGVGTLIEGYGIEVKGIEGLVAQDPVLCTIEENASRWGRLDEARQSASGRSRAAEEAAKKLIGNHEAVLRDVVNPMAKTQTGIKRLDMIDAPYVDEALREVSRILLGKPAGLEALERPDERQARVWLATASYLDRRLQSSRVESPGRDPDMSVEAAAAFRVALAEVAQLASEALGVTTPSEQEPPQNAQP